jgi:phenylacetate-coenzyme A ligase PaaK-like adenylate-forming protein
MVNRAVEMLDAAGYIPQKSSWTPPDDALYGVKELFRLPDGEAERLRYKAVKYSFNHWYENSEWYHRYVNEFEVTPDDVKSPSDLSKIPCISHRFFKTYLEGADFATWVSQVLIGESVDPKVSKGNPSLDDMINAFMEQGLLTAYSSGTSGRFSFIPKDRLTYIRSQYCLGKMGISEILGDWYEPKAYAYLFGPNPSRTKMWVGKVVELMDYVYKDVQYALDKDITTQLVRLSLGDIRGITEKIMATIIQIIRTTSNMIPKIIKWLEERESQGDKVFLAEAPFIFQALIKRLEEQDRNFDFREKGAIITGGGWKTHEDEKTPMNEFRKNVEKVLGIPEKNHVDLYTMVESNWHAIQCPEGHYLHLPPTVVYPMVLGENLKPIDPEEPGRFAFIDPLANSYPGAIITGDIVKLYERCPVCDRVGPVLEPEVRRASGEEIRGCAEEMRRLIDEQTPELLHDLVCTPDRSRMPLMLLEREE